MFKGLDNLILPFTSHLLEGLDDSQYANAQYDEKDKYFIKSVSGLEPPDRTIAIARTASGGKFQGASTVDREVVVLIGLNPDFDNGETYALLRQNLYTMLTPGYDPKVDIQLVAGIFPIYHEYAYVTKFEADIFTKDPVVQITFTTLNPTFRAFSPITYDPTELSQSAPNVYNTGTSETGFQFAVKFTATKNGWYIKQAENQNVGMTFDMTFNAGDVLAVSTIQGQKYIHWNKHRGKVKNMIGILTADSEWIQLHPGNNHFVVPKKASAWDWNGKLAFTPHYWGI